MDQIVVAGFEEIADRFRAIGAGRPGWSGACTVHVDGRPVLDVWAGPAYRSARPFAR